VARLFGFEQDELVGASLLELIPEDLREAHRRGLARYLETGERSLDWGSVQFPARRQDGKRLEVEVSFGEYEVAGQRLFTGMIRDISDRKEAEEALRRAQEMFEGVFETSPVGLKIVDAETQEYRTVNESFTQQFGYTRQEVESGEVRDEDLWPDLEIRRQIYDRVERGGTVRNVEVRLGRKDGGVFDALFSASPLSVNDRRYLVAAIQDISYQKEVERELTHRALHDELTGLPNRALLDDRLRHALERSERSGEALAVLFVDLKRFKVINDSLGHEAGDRVLEEVADRLLDAVRAQDTVARIGGDEFAVFLEDIADEGATLTAADRVVRAFDEPVVLGDQEVAVEASVGVVVHEAAGGERPAPTDLLRWADEAMYRAKNKPGTARVLAAPDHPSTDTTRIEREQRLRAALEAGELGTVYQPIFGVQDGELRGVEALCRWHDPELGEVSPGTFIPLAEETGLIVELGEQQLDKACRSLLPVEGPEGKAPGRPLRLHVNLSSRQLEDPDVVGRVSAVLERTGFPADRLCLEVTESAATREPETVDELGRLGVDLAIDDFGTRYSTLTQLKRLRVHALKIDRSFVAGLPDDDRDRAIVASVLTLGHALGLAVVAEGVETEEQLEFLRELGGDEAQGFHLARPMSIEALRTWLEARP
jgi:diguanylate cyclase (GGDEF)-like protein/PAS domain S-box-containing protein